jgi:hypothetical protein
MKRGMRDVVRAFLDELGAVPFTEDEPLYRIGRRLLFAELVLAEVRDDDLEGVALRSLAAVARQLCLSPTDREVIERVHRGAAGAPGCRQGSIFRVGGEIPRRSSSRAMQRRALCADVAGLGQLHWFFG